MKRYSIFLFVSEECIPCVDMMEHLVKMKKGILDNIKVHNIKTQGGDIEMLQDGYFYNIKKAPTLLVVDEFAGEDKERITGPKNVMQNIRRVLKKYT